MTPVEILKAARELIAKPERWTRGVIARSGSIRLSSAMDPDATCWCAMGAIDKCAATAMKLVATARAALAKAGAL